MSSEKDSAGTPKVRYLPVTDFPGYIVGDDGSVWHRAEGSRNAVRLATRTTGGYKVVNLSVYATAPSGVVRRYTTPVAVHRLILETFIAPAPEGWVACHINDVPTDNRLVNLRWGTHRLNALDRSRNHGGTLAKLIGGGRQGRAKAKTKLLQVRVLRGVGLNTLATECGLGVHKLTCLERGGTATPAESHAVSAALEANADDLFDETGKPLPPCDHLREQLLAPWTKR